MLKRLRIALFIAAISGAHAEAQSACPLTYRAFEFAVPHLDLPECPADLARADVFCRATAGNDAVHVFVFAQAGEQCLLAVKSYSEYTISVK